MSRMTFQGMVDYIAAEDDWRAALRRFEQLNDMAPTNPRVLAHIETLIAIRRGSAVSAPSTERMQ